MLTIFYYELEFTPSRIAFSDDSSAALKKTEKREEEETKATLFGSDIESTSINWKKSATKSETL